MNQDLQQKTIWTIGHSNRDIAEFVLLLKENAIESLVDVRRFPGSRKWPEYNHENLASTLREEAIAYTHMLDLGGRRKPAADSKNIAWRNASFRAYADYTETSTFRKALELLMRMANEAKIAIMCSEAEWWRCHRAIISDYLKAAGWTVLHIMASKKSQEHPYTSAAMLVDDTISYKGLLGG